MAMKLMVSLVVVLDSPTVELRGLTNWRFCVNNASHVGKVKWGWKNSFVCFVIAVCLFSFYKTRNRIFRFTYFSSVMPHLNNEIWVSRIFCSFWGKVTIVFVHPTKSASCEDQFCSEFSSDLYFQGYGAKSTFSKCWYYWSKFHVLFSKLMLEFQSFYWFALVVHLWKNIFVYVQVFPATNSSGDTELWRDRSTFLSTVTFWVRFRFFSWPFGQCISLFNAFQLNLTSRGTLFFIYKFPSASYF